MEGSMSIIAFLCLVYPCLSVPQQVIFEKPEVQNDAEQSTKHRRLNLFEITSNENDDSSQSPQGGDLATKPRRSAMTCLDNGCFWPKNSAGTVNVPYRLSGYSDRDATTITDAMKEYASMTCIRFVARKRELSYLYIIAQDRVIGTGNCNINAISEMTGAHIDVDKQKDKTGDRIIPISCWAYMGRKGGPQLVALNYECMTKGSIQHELNHALGFHHEQSRTDRDNYVRILLQFVDPVNHFNFNKAATNNLGLQYDYSSIMHYALDAFTNTNGKATILPKRKHTMHIGQRKGMSNLDVAKINQLYNCSLCSTINSNGFGFMNSTNYPSQYPNNINCSYLMRSASSQLLLTFNAFNVEASQDCQSDYVTIYDGITRDSPILLNRACGRKILPPVLSSSNALLMEFVTNGAVKASGFSAYFSNVVCAHIYTNQSGTVTSENYPANYPPTMDCRYYLWAPAGSKISLKFNDFNLEEMPIDCQLDYILIYNGATTNSPLIGRYCGTGPVPNIVSSSNNLLITFHSDSMNQRKGFSASYTIVRG